QGFAARVAPLDDYAGQLPREGAVMIATASYNGTPPDNAVQFCDWLRGGALAPGALAGVICARDEAEPGADFEGQFHPWYKPLWNTVAAELGIDLGGRGTPTKEPLYTLEIVPGERMSPFVDSLGARAMAVTVNRELHRRD